MTTADRVPPPAAPPGPLPLGESALLVARLYVDLCRLSTAACRTGR
ncbi:putative leader peptide [Streptomyces carminius]|nr:putative leader peptide [Streptomyces carminius]